MSWKDEQHFEKNWHGNCVNSYWEETKQIVYAKRMGLKAEMIDGKYPVYDLKGISVLDIGGGAYSMLLKCINFKGTVFDPCDYPKWIEERYKEAGIEYRRMKGEDLDQINLTFDVGLIYNVLQHVDNPEKIIKNARKICSEIRIFEWIDNGISPGHPWDLKEEKLNKWLGGIGKIEQLNEQGCKGKSYYGIFKGDTFKENRL